MNHPTEPADLEQAGIAAYLSGREADSIDIHTRAHNAALKHGDTRQAVRSAFWIAFAFLGSRELERVSGWIARAQRLLDDDPRECVERGYVLLPQAVTQIMRGDFSAAEATFLAIEQIGERFSDANLTCMARQGRGRILIARGRLAEGVALFDEVMVAVTAGEVAPIFSGIVYCSIISACFDLLDLRRAQVWTDALSHWCEADASTVPYRGECLAHRAEIFGLHGRWPDALEQATRAYDSVGTRGPVKGASAYRIAEINRLRGDFAAAEAHYERAVSHGHTPHPGLALLRLAAGQIDAARQAIERVRAEPQRGRRRAEILSAAAEILAAAGDVTTAQAAATELAAIEATMNSDWLRALSVTAAGRVQLAAGDARQALPTLRDASRLWDDLDAPYESARVHVLIGRTCDALGDADGARMEWDGAARVFARFGAQPALTALDALRQAPAGHAAATTGPLTARELEVLRLIASGRTNRAIADALDISEKTVARHISNIFTKLDLSSRAAATAYAFTHGLAGQPRG